MLLLYAPTYNQPFGIDYSSLLTTTSESCLVRCKVRVVVEMFAAITSILEEHHHRLTSLHISFHLPLGHRQRHGVTQNLHTFATTCSRPLHSTPCDVVHTSCSPYWTCQLLDLN